MRAAMLMKNIPRVCWWRLIGVRCSLGRTVLRRCYFLLLLMLVQLLLPLVLIRLLRHLYPLPAAAIPSAAV